MQGGFDIVKFIANGLYRVLIVHNQPTRCFDVLRWLLSSSPLTGGSSSLAHWKHSVYDVTIGYKYCCPSFLDNVFWVDPSEAHIHIHSFPLDCIPESEDEISMYLIDRF